MIVLSILMFLAMVIRYNMGWYEMPIVDVPVHRGTMSVCSFYLMSQREIFGEQRPAAQTRPRCRRWASGSANNAEGGHRGPPRHGIGVHARRSIAEAAGDDWRLCAIAAAQLRALRELASGCFTVMAYTRRQRHLRDPALHPALPV